MNSPIVEATGLTRWFDGPERVCALNDVSLRVDAGEFVAIVGGSGSGKTTLLSILGLLDRPSSGTYKIGGEDVSNCSPRERDRIRRSDLGFIFQHFHLVPFKSVAENVELGVGPQVSRSRRASEARAVLDQVGLGPRAEFRPPQLSGGERQRVAIARALIRAPSLILADEPTGNLDSTNRDAVLGLLDAARRSSRRTAVVVVTHDVDVAARADRLIRLVDGGVVANGREAGGRH